jgi:polysaccharide pyruvyl transferase WcaK-like protein
MSGQRTGGIAIMGHVGAGNLGDEAIVSAVVARLRAQAPDVALVAFTVNPQDTTARHGVPAYPIRSVSERRPGEPAAAGTRTGLDVAAERVRRIPWLKVVLRPAVLFARAVIAVVRETGFDVRSFRRLKGVRLIVFAGSGQLNDDIGGPLKYPLTILRWSVLARLRGAKVSVASIGAGPVDTALGRLFLRLALRLTAYRSFRDPSSLALARRIGAPEPNLLVRDLAFSHPRLAAARAPAPLGQSLRVGVNPLSIVGGASWQMHDRRPYEQYVTAHVALTRGLLERGWRVVLFPTQLTMDPEPIEDVVRQLGAETPALAGAVEAATGLTDESDLVDLLEGLDLAVATRYHGVLLALASGIPTVAVAYAPKTRDLMEHFGLGAWCLDLEGLTGQVLLDRVTLLASQREAVRATLAERRGRDLADLLIQYDRLLELAATRTSRRRGRLPLAATGRRVPVVPGSR